MSIRQWTTPYLYVVKSELGSAEHEDTWNRWYSDVHVRDLLTVPGIRGATRYRELTERGSYLAIYEIDSPEVFAHPRYQDVTGWGDWEQHVKGWTRTIVGIESDELRPGSSALSTP